MRNCKLCTHEPHWEEIEGSSQLVGFCKYPIPFCIPKDPIYTFRDEPTCVVLRKVYNIELKVDQEAVIPIDDCQCFQRQTA